MPRKNNNPRAGAGTGEDGASKQNIDTATIRHAQPEIKPSLSSGFPCPATDAPWLKGQLRQVFKIMADRQWHTVPQVAAAVGCCQTGASARLRDLRKKKHGSFKIERKRLISGEMCMYRLAGRESAE